MKDLNNDIPGQSEDALQQKCYVWFWNRYPYLRGLLFAVPNGGARDAKEGKKFKLTGLVPGVSDLIFLYRTQAYLIELKKDDKAQLSTNQKEWKDIVEHHGFVYFVVRSLTDFKRLMNQLIVE